MFGKTRQVHFVGIGGSGMCGIAEILLSEGFRVSGSDLAMSANTERLEDLGADVTIGHAARNLGDADVVVVSSAVPEDNPEIRAARRHSVPVIARAEMLAELMKLKYSIAVGGTHGKTTTTAMTATLLEHAGRDPTVIDGGRLVHLDSGARIGRSEFLVAEADEAYGSIKRFNPSIAVFTSIDADHLDYYADLQEIADVFTDFANRVPFFGMVVMCLDDDNVRRVIPDLHKRHVTYGLHSDADVTASEVAFCGMESQFVISRDGERLGAAMINLPGEHNVRNALAAVCVAMELGVSFSDVVAGLASFKGVRRRFEILGEADGVLVVDDYAHNPAKLQAVFAGAKAAFPQRRLVAAFQPHRYHRLKSLADEFARSFADTEALYITEIYGAGEDPIEGVSAENLVAAIRAQGHLSVTHVATNAGLTQRLVEDVRPGDLLLIAGAGDIGEVGLDVLNARKAAALAEAKS